MDKTDRKRLEQVQAADLTESRVNEDFVEWLKTKGPSWLLVVLVAISAYVAIVRFRLSRDQGRREAWVSLMQASLPESYVDVADAHGDVDGIADLALRTAADQRLLAVQVGVPVSALGAESGETDAVLTDEERAQYLDGADRLYRRIVESDDGSDGRTLHVVNACFGLAAVAESKGDAAGARSWYDRAAARAEGRYRTLAAEARLRASTVRDDAGDVNFVPRTELDATRPTPPARTVAPVDPLLDGIIEDAASPADGAAADE